jgi:hypothetical protein
MAVLALAAAPGTATPAPHAGPAPAAAAADRQRGVCFVAGPEVRAGAFDELAARGVTWISQTPFGWQRGLDSPQIEIVTDGRIYWGERDSGLVATARLARARGIRTLLKPHLWVMGGGPGGGHAWCGDIAMRSEADWQRWFARYQEFIVHYARLAEAAGIEALCVGTELQGTTQREADWRRVIAAVRRVYRGRLVYAANWSGEFERVRFWDALDWIGVQAYFPLSNASESSVDELVAAWRPHVAQLEAVARRTGRPIVLTEIGYKASDFATKEPWTWTTADRPNPDEQARAYEAAFRALWNRPWLAGMYWWKWFPDGHPEAHGRDRFFTPQEKPAAGVLAKWYRAG